MRALAASALLLLVLAGAFALWRGTSRPAQGLADAALQPAPAAPPVEAPPALVHAEEPPPAAFVDEATCALCHPAEAEAWRGSDHDLAMQEATRETVLGDFADARFEDQSGMTRFLRESERFVVETAGSGGEPQRFDVPHVFGVDPLQQLLLPLERGRLQALAVAWDARARRWFSLYPGERIPPEDPLHWTRPALNWNFVCAECHATELRRGYDPARDAFATTAHRYDVGCQACHGPAGRHVEWAMGDAELTTSGLGFDAPLGVHDSTVEVEACARCHARRAPLWDGFDHRHRLMDDYLPALLSEELYFADGQIRDEVYEYGSFLQSKMHARNVRCSDCHEPHSLGPRRPGNTLCAGCHSPAPSVPEHVDASQLPRRSYDSPEHHHHPPGGPGSLCVDCHMPVRTYMVVDSRRDHGFRVPRPDLAGVSGAPEICSGCHAERDPAWAAAEIERWYGPKKRAPHFGVALLAGRSGAKGAADGLLALAGSGEAAIVRATALELLQRYPGRPALAAFAAGLADPDGLVRHAALGGLELLSPEERVPLAAPLLSDPLRAVRAEAARILRPADARALGRAEESWRWALAEFEAIQRHLLERPEAHLNLAQLFADTGRPRAAEAELRAAVKLDPSFAPAHVNLAEVVRTTKGEGEAEGVLRDGIPRAYDPTPLWHALGLALVRQGRREEALAALREAARLAPEVARFGYVLAVALHDGGEPAAARAELERVLARHPEDRDARFALASYLEQVGDAAGARRCLEELAAINPHDPGLESAIAPR